MWKGPHLIFLINGSFVRFFQSSINKIHPEDYLFYTIPILILLPHALDTCKPFGILRFQ